MSSRDEKFLNQGLSVIGNKVYANIDSGWKIQGLINDLNESIFIENGIISFTFDSSFDAIKDAITPIINLETKDLSNNNISWSVSNGVNYGGSIVKTVGVPPLITVVPFKNPNDDAKIDVVKLSAQVGGGLPDLGYDSFDPILYGNNSVDIEITYDFSSFYVTYTNTEKAYGLIDLGTPNVEYISNVPFSLPGDIEGIDFNQDGSELYLISDNTNTVYQYSVPTTFDLTTTVNTPSQFTPYKYHGTNFSDIKISKNGERMYLLDRGNNKVRQYNLSDSFDITTAEILEFYHEADDFGEFGFISDSANKMFSLKNNIVYSWDLSEPYRISSAEYSPSKNISLGNYRSTFTTFGYTTYGGGQPFFTRSFLGGGFWRTRYEHIAPLRTICFSKDGRYMYTASGIAIFNGELERYVLSTPWDISTASRDERILHEFGISTAQNYERNYKDNEITDIKISDDGSAFFILDKYTASLYQFNLSTPYSLDSLSFTIKPVPKVAYVGGYDYKYSLSQIPNPTPTDPYISENYIHSLDFYDSGRKIYIINDSDVYSYSLQDPFNISSVSFIGNTHLSYLDKPSSSINVRGEYLYLHNRNITYQLNLDSSFSNSYNDKSLLINSTNNITSIDINDSGNTMYIGGDNDDIHKYSLSDNYEIYSANLDSSLQSTQGLTNLQGLCVKEQIDKIFALDNSGFIYEVDIRDSFSSSLFNGTIYQTTGNHTAHTDIAFNNNGDLFFISGNSGIDTYRTKTNFNVKPI